MAGSWDHMTTDGGKLRNNDTFCGMIENLGDAYEAAEECFGMVQYLAAQLEGVSNTNQAYWIRQAKQHYLEGLELGGVQKP
jgi:hypothetical protein